ncbi:MAG: carboxypeptidase-like regulatory domain-containing protein, partial [Bacteroidota bacterium]
MQYIVTLLATLFLSVSLPAQSIKVSGTVTNKETGEPMLGVTIFEKGTTNGTFSDESGIYALNLTSDSAQIVARFVGYQTKTFDIKPGSETVRLNIKIEADAVMLDEVVVTALGTSRTRSSRDVSSSVAGYDYAPKRSSAKRSVKGGRKRRKAPAVASTSTTTAYKPATKSEKKVGVKSDLGYVAEESAEAFDDMDGDGEAGKLTAGELHDFSKWELWKDIAANQLSVHKTTWKAHPVERYTLQFTTESGFPIPDADVRLLDKKGQIWQARTDNTGKAELWANAYTDGLKASGDLSAAVSYKGQTFTLDNLKPLKEGVNILKAAVDCPQPKVVDIAFVVDGTGSMGDEISFLKAELKDIMDKVKHTLPDMKVNLGSVFYRDGTGHVPDHSDFSEDIKKTTSFISGQYASGGGDFPEAVELGMDVAVNKLTWSPNAVARIAFLILDAPPHSDKATVKKMQTVMEDAARQGIRVIPVVGSGIDKSTEYLMRTMALLTNGTYVFLTDDSGIGGAHIKPTTDEFEVETLNALMLRLIFQYTQTSNCQQLASQPEAADADTMLVYHPDFLKPPKDEQQVIQSQEVTEGDTTVIIKKVDKLEKDQLIKWKYWPSPTTGIVHVEVQGKVGELFVTDLSGKILQRHSVPKDQVLDIDISDFPAGVYYIKYAYSEDRWLSGKVVLVHCLLEIKKSPLLVALGSNPLKMHSHSAIGGEHFS